MPSILTILYWVILILSILSVFVPLNKYPNAYRICGSAWVALFIIIGLKLFKTPIQ